MTGLGSGGLEWGGCSGLLGLQLLKSSTSKGRRMTNSYLFTAYLYQNSTFCYICSLRPSYLLLFIRTLMIILGPPGWSPHLRSAKSLMPCHVTCRFQGLKGRYLWRGHYFALLWVYVSLTLLGVNTSFSKAVLPSFSSTSRARIGQLPCQHPIL